MVPLPLVLSLSELDLLESSFFFFESDPLRCRNTSKIVGRRLGLAVPCTVDWFSTGPSSPLRRLSSEPDRPLTRSVLRDMFSCFRLSFSNLAASRSSRRAVSRSIFFCSFSCFLASRSFFLIRLEDRAESVPAGAVEGRWNWAPPSAESLVVPPFFAFGLPDDGVENAAAGNVADLEDATVDDAPPADGCFFGDDDDGSVSERLTHTSSSSNGIGFLLVELALLVVLSSGETPIPVDDVILLVIGRISTSDESKKRLSRWGLGNGDAGEKMLLSEVRSGLN